MSSREAEALDIFSELLEYVDPTYGNLKVMLRKCIFACELLGWQDKYNHFYKELYGFNYNDQVPGYRVIFGRGKWYRVKEYELKVGIGRTIRGLLKKEDPVGYVSYKLVVRGNIEWIESCSESGYLEATDVVKKIEGRYSYSGPHRLYRYFPKELFVECLSDVHRTTLDFVSHAYIELKYGKTVQGIWEKYRKCVDGKINELNMKEHLETIESGINSDNPQSWRAAVFACRNLFEDIANYLWQDSRKTYEYLPGNGEDGKLRVTANESKNRISAYLHQKGFYNSTRAIFNREEVERLDASIRSLYRLQSTPHSVISKEDALTISIATYFILGEMILKTDMTPVKQYKEPAFPKD